MRAVWLRSAGRNAIPFSARTPLFDDLISRHLTLLSRADYSCTPCCKKSTAVSQMASWHAFHEGRAHPLLRMDGFP